VTSTNVSDRRDALVMRGVSKSFHGLQALDRVDFSVAAGTVHALLGENGAGKSTLMRIAYGLTVADVGAVRLFGSLGPRSPREATAAGVGMVQQHLSVIPTLTAAENVALGADGRFDERLVNARIRQLATESGLDVPLGIPARDMSLVQRQRLEILKALSRNARLLILDEPTAVLAPGEIDDLLRWIRAFASNGGSVVIVTHKLREAIGVADDVTVLRRGTVVYAGRAEGTSESQLAAAIFPDHRGESSAADSAIITPSASAGDIVVTAERLEVRDARGAIRIQSASLTIRRREIVGVAAIEGSGHRELLLALAGLATPAAGIVHLPSRIAIIPADRQREALVPDFTLTENVALRALGTRRGLMRWPDVQRRTRSLIERFAIAVPSEDTRVATLSGGNQQRLVIARELEQDIDLVVADNPTRGLDLLATRFVHEELRAAASRGAAVVVHSSDLDEVLALATRVLVVFRGTVRDVAPSRDDVGRAMLGAA
jgi:ABC-type uncharacterized transport system ATPase subunit